MLVKYFPIYLSPGADPYPGGFGTKLKLAEQVLIALIACDKTTPISSL